MVTAGGPDEALRLLEAVRRPIRGMSWEAPLTQAVAEALDLEEGNRCYQAAYFRGPPAGQGRRAALDMSFFQAVLDGYSLFHDPGMWRTV